MPDCSGSRQQLIGAGTAMQNSRPATFLSEYCITEHDAAVDTELKLVQKHMWQANNGLSQNLECFVCNCRAESYTGSNISFSEGAGSFAGVNTFINGSGIVSGNDFTCIGEGEYQVGHCARCSL